MNRERKFQINMLMVINLITQVFIRQILQVLQRNNITNLLFLDTSPSCGLHRAIDKWCNGDWDTQICSLVWVRSWSSFDELELAKMRKTGNFLSILSNFSLCYVVNSVSTANKRGVALYPLSFSQRIYTIWKNDPWGLPKTGIPSLQISVVLVMTQT